MKCLTENTFLENGGQNLPFKIRKMKQKSEDLQRAGLLIE